MQNQITQEANAAIRQLLEAAKPQAGDIVVIGCSTSEVAGHRIGSYSNIDLAQALFDGIYPVVQEHGLYLAAQCCEHLNRSLIVEADCAKAYGLEQVNVIPFPKAGGSFATAAYQHFAHPVAVRKSKRCAAWISAARSLGMHLKNVERWPDSVLFHHPKSARGAPITCARTRPKFVGGERAHYDEALL